MAYTRGKYYIYEDVNGKFFLDGVFIPKNVIDEFVVMRYAELEKEKKLKKIEKRSMKKWQGNFGCDALLEKYGKETAIQILKKFHRKKRKRKNHGKAVKKTEKTKYT